jgi:hypothetical protein
MDEEKGSRYIDDYRFKHEFQSYILVIAVIVYILPGVIMMYIMFFSKQ